MERIVVRCLILKAKNTHRGKAQVRAKKKGYYYVCIPFLLSYSFVFPHTRSTTTETLIYFFSSLLRYFSPLSVKATCFTKCLNLRISTYPLFVSTLSSPHEKSAGTCRLAGFPAPGSRRRRARPGRGPARPGCRRRTRSAPAACP